MTREKAIEAIINYFEENKEEFNACIEDLDSYDGYLGDDRYYDMEMIDEIYAGVEPSELMNRIFYGHDEDTWHTDEHGEREYGEFNPRRNYFTYNGYGNLVSTDYKDYSDKLDSYFAEKVIDLKEQLWNVPEEISAIIDSIR